MLFDQLSKYSNSMEIHPRMAWIHQIAEICQRWGGMGRQDRWRHGCRHRAPMGEGALLAKHCFASARTHSRQRLGRTAERGLRRVLPVHAAPPAHGMPAFAVAVAVEVAGQRPALPGGRVQPCRKTHIKKQQAEACCFGVMVRPERFELPTAWFVARYSIQLSYGRAVHNQILLHFQRRMLETCRVVRPERFELPTAWFVARYSIQLSYGRPATGAELCGCRRVPSTVL